MSDTIIVAVISLLGTLGGSYWANRKNTALIAYRLEQLELKVNRHNSIIERMYHLETEQSVVEEQIKVINHRLQDLEQDMKGVNENER